MVFVRKTWGRNIQLEKEDINKWYIWFKISMRDKLELQLATSP